MRPVDIDIEDLHNETWYNKKICLMIPSINAMTNETWVKILSK